MKKNGYTLLEIILVLALISVFAAAVLPAMINFTDRRLLEADAREMVGEFFLATHTAMTKGRTYRIEFYPQANAYQVFCPGGRRLIRLSEGIRYASNNFPVEGGGYRVLSFNRNGNPNRGGTVSLINRHGDRLYIIVAATTGRVRISTTPPENWEIN